MKLTTKNIENQAIADNLEICKVIMYIYRGQVLEMDLRDFCIKYEVCSTKNSFDWAIEKMIKGNIIKRRIYPNTEHIVLVAKTALNRFMCKVDDSIDFSAEQVRFNSFLTYLLISNIEKRERCNITKMIEDINSSTTFLHKKYDITNGYNFFKNNFKLDKLAYLHYRCAMYRATKGLKNINNEYSEKDDMGGGYTNSFASFVNKGVYTQFKDDECTFFILDIVDNLNASKVGKNIGYILGTLYEQVDRIELLDTFNTVKFVVVTKDDVRRMKIFDSFKVEYKEEHTSRGKTFEVRKYKEHLRDAIVRAAKKRVNNIRVNYSDKNKGLIDKFEFINQYSDSYGLNLVVEVVSANVNNKLSTENKVAKLKEARKIKHEEEIKARHRRELYDEVLEEVKEHYERLYSAREEDIRQQVLREYNLDYPTLEVEMKELAELNELDKSKKEPK